MRGIFVVLALTALISSATLFGQREGGPNQPARQSGGVQTGRQGAPPPAGRQGITGRGARNRRLASGTAVIRGRVVTSDTGTPLRRAQLQASVAGERPRGALTDADGRFELRDLPAGSWMIRAAKTGFVTQQYGQRGPFATSEPVMLKDGQQFTADFALMRGGAITGRVYDEFGDPVATVRVGALRVQASPAGRRLVASGSSVATDDTGAYRVYGLAPGAYYISANVMATPAANGPLATSEGPVTYAPVYFPGTTDLGAAQQVVVAPGQEQVNIHLALTPARAARVSGVVLGSAGTPIQAMVTLRYSMFVDGVGAGGPNVGTPSDGTFTLPNVAPGNYTLDVMGRVASPDAPPDVASVPIAVTGDDITGLTITTTHGAKMIGTIAADDGTRLPTAGIRVTAPSIRSAQGRWTPRTQVTGAGTFELEGLIGAHTLRFEQLPAGWVLKSITANGLDIADVPLDLRGSEQLSVRVVLTNRVTELAGTIRGDSVAGASVLVFPDDESKWTLVSRYLRTTRVSDGGQFSLKALPPHQRYLAMAIDYLESGEHLDPEFLRRVKPSATAFSLSEGEQKTVDLTLVAHR
jgi:hypothetical protein